MRLSGTLLHTWLVATGIGLFVPEPLNGQEEDPLYFVFRESEFTDSDWQGLATTFADEIPLELWRPIAVQPGDGLYRIIDRYYDIYAGDLDSDFAAPLPETTELLARLIVARNGLSSEVLEEGQIIRIPPLPVRAATGTTFHNTWRHYDPTNSQYWISTWSPEAHVRQSVPGFVPAVELQPFRFAEETILPITSEQSRRLAQLSPNGQVHQLLMARVELLQTQECMSADDQLEASPYLRRAQTRLRNLLPQIVEAAAERKLALVDFDFDRGHGAKVRSAALWVLEKVGVREVLEPYVENVELTPRRTNALRLQDALVSYSDWLLSSRENDMQVKLASWWTIAAPDIATGESVRMIPAAMISAVLWQELNQGDYLNLSWKLETAMGIQPLGIAQALRQHSSFVSVAAGNRTEEVRADLFPQGAASIFRSFVNVTYGARDGRLYGSRTGSMGGGKVDLLAIGCGIDFNDLRQSDRGSSFASPVVAAAAWVKALADSVSANELRAALIRASLLVQPASMRRTTSGGYFDPAKLIASLGPHYLDASFGKVVPLTDVTVNAGSCGVFSSVSSRSPLQDLIVYESENQYFVLRRHDVQEFPGVRLEPPCAITTLTLEAVGPDGRVKIESPQHFVESIGHLTF